MRDGVGRGDSERYVAACARRHGARTDMQISLTEEFLLLALEDEGGQFSRIPETSFSCGIAGAALMDLEIRGRIATGQQVLEVVDSSPTGLPMLDRLLA